MIRNKSCTDCKLSLSCKSTCLMAVPSQKPLMVISNYPSEEDDEAGTIMQTGKDTIIKRIFDLAGGVDIGAEVYSTYAIKCNPNGADVDLEACLQYLKEEVAIVKPKCIIVFGEIPFRMLFGPGTAVINHLGKIFNTRLLGSDFLKTPIIANYETEYIDSLFYLNNQFSQNVSQKFADILQKAHNIATEQEAVSDVGDLTKTVVIRNIEQVKELVEYCKIAKFASFDFETTTLNHFEGKKPTSLAITFQPGSAYFLPMWHFSRVFTKEEQTLLNYYIDSPRCTKKDIDTILSIIVRKAGASKDIDIIIEYLVNYTLPLFEETEEKEAITFVELDEILLDRLLGTIEKEEWTETFIHESIKLLGEGVFSNPAVDKVAHNAQFDALWLLIEGISIRGRLDDTMLMHYVLQNNRPHGLKVVVSEYYPEFEGYEDEISKYSWDSIPFNLQVRYNCFDTDITTRLKISLEAELVEIPESYIFYRNLTLPVMKSLINMRYRGIYVDIDTLDKYIEKANNYADEVISELKGIPEVIKFEEYKRTIEKKAKILELELKIENAQGKVAEGNTKKVEKLQEEISTLEALLEVHRDDLLVEQDELSEKLQKESELQNSLESQEFTKEEIKELKKELKTQNTSINQANKIIFSLEKKINIVSEKITQKNQKIGDLSDNFDNSHVKNWKMQISNIKAGVLQVYGGVSFTSPQQLGEFLYSAKGLGYSEIWDYKTRTHKRGTDRKTLEKFEDDTGALELINRFKSIKHSLGTFLNGIREKLDDNGYLHSDFNQLIETGRLSSRKPNLQNIPPEGRIKDKIAGEVAGYCKRSFTIPEGFVMLEADYSQAELRVVADYSKDVGMIEAYTKGEDLHVKTGCRMAHISIDKYYNELEKSEQKPIRQNAKAANFGLIYKQSPKGYKIYASDTYGVLLSDAEAQEQHKLFFEIYPGIPKYHDRIIKQAEKQGYVSTMFGYRRYLQDINSFDSFVKGEAERAAVNTPIQGTAGQLTLFALVLLEQRLHKSVTIVNTIHDSIYFMIPESRLESTKLIVRQTMENLPTKKYFKKSIDSVPMAIDFKQGGESWGTMVEL